MEQAQKEMCNVFQYAKDNKISKIAYGVSSNIPNRKTVWEQNTQNKVFMSTLLQYAQEKYGKDNVFIENTYIYFCNGENNLE